MPRLSWFGALAIAAFVFVPEWLGLEIPVAGDTITLKSGVVYRGTVDRDNTLVFIFDGLKRVALRDSKIARVDSDTAFRNLENFKLVQPLEVHVLEMPTYAISVQASPWDAFGRRNFRYVGPKSNKPITMKQALIELGPYLCTLRGIDGSWRSQLSTTQVPKDVVLGLLKKVEQTNENERKRVVRFLIQAEWYDEAKREIDRLEKDFPANEQLKVVRQSVQQLDAEQCQAEIDMRRRALQPKGVLARLKAFPTDGVQPELLTKVREQLRQEEAQIAADKELAEQVQSVAEQLPDEPRKAWKAALVEILAALADAPDAVRARLDAFRKAEPAVPPEGRFALALTGWVLGADAATPDLATAEQLWKARNLINDYLRSPVPELRNDRLATLQALEWTDSATSTHKIDLESATRLARLAPPPLADDKDKSPEPGKPKIYQVLNDGNEAPTEYGVLLPPEYDPLRSYPAVLALHSGMGETPADRIRGAIAWWATEATRRGYIVIAPEYNLPGETPDYRYRPSEHAAAELALRDAKRRFAIDSDRVFLGGQLLGGNMAWDYGLAHPDLFAGVAIVSGMPAKYVDRYRGHAEHVPLYIAHGDLAGNDLVFALGKAMILKTYDVTYVDYFRRGLEDFPEETVPIFDWMDHRGPRDQVPKKFEAVSARTCDDRFYGVVLRQFAAGRTMAPEAVDALGKNLHPATIDFQCSALSNLVKVTANGVTQLDVWVSPKLVDFKKRVEVRVNGKSFFKGPVKQDLAPFLEDLRIRGDRQQVYWLKVSAR